ncbi:MAG: hypothetical protein WDN44_05955 [Sphingomonas sp.]
MHHVSGMCIVNSALVEDLAPLAGSQAAVMEKLGISWNSWIKIVAGLPIRRSVGLRVKERALAVEGIKRRFPSASAPDGIDRAALDDAFLLPAESTPAPARLGEYGPRSLRQARSLRCAGAFRG